MEITMNRIRLLRIAVFVFAIVVLAQSCFASDYASFESFYKEGSIWGWVVGSILVVASVLLVVVTGGTASPIVAGIGSAIGGMMGLSGAAATSAGLALLGGGSLAAGGFGMLGGTVLLTAILEGGTLVGSQYVDSIMRHQDYKELCERMKDYPNFPPIKNTSGPKEIGEVVDILNEDYDVQQLPSSAGNERAVRDAIWALDKYRPEPDRFYKIGYNTVIRHENLRVKALYSLLYFMQNDYQKAYDYAKRSMSYFDGAKEDGYPSVPDFIIATAGLVIKKETPQASLNLFSHVVSNEKDSPLLPLLFSIYISRAGAMEAVNSDFLKRLANVAGYIGDEDIARGVQSLLATAMLSKIWEYREEISVIAANVSQFDLAQAKQKCRYDLAEYEALLDQANYYLRRFPSGTSDERTFKDKMVSALSIYTEKLPEVRQLAAQVEAYREPQKQPQQTPPSTQAVARQGESSNAWIWILAALVCLGILLLVGKSQKKGKGFSGISGSGEGIANSQEDNAKMKAPKK